MKEGGNAVHCVHQGRGDAILFIHGMPTNHMLWDGIIQQLSSHHRCFAIDLPGMGETRFTPYSPDYLDRQATQIELLRIQHGVKKWHVVGHDAGSAIAVQYAACFSQHVACLALMSPAIFPELKPFYLLNALRKPLMGEVLAPLLHFVFWKIAMRRALAGESNSTLLRAFSEPFSGLTGAWQLMRLVRWGRPEDILGEIPAKLTTLSMPTLLFHGSRDVLPASFAERAASLIPHSRVVTLDTGHFIPLDKPKDVAVCLRSFFAENRATKDLYIRTTNRSARSARSRALLTEPLTF
jgi:pimeloyl-ACP methyl ester carboxylesterase